MLRKTLITVFSLLAFNCFADESNVKLKAFGPPVNSGFVTPGTTALRPPADRATDMLNVKDFGAKGDGVTDDSTSLINADAYALANGYRTLYFPHGSYLAPNLGTIGLNYLPTGYLPNTVLVGDGQITGSNGYRRVSALDAPSPYAETTDVIPSVHLKNASTKISSSPLVVDIMGDSTCQAANNIAPSEILSSTLYTKIQLDNPGRSITFNNRCIGGRSWPDANGVSGDTSPGWYTNATTPWLTYVANDQPDILIFNFGMNPDNTGSVSGGAGGVDLPSFHGVMTKVAAFAKVPSVIFATNMQPSYNPTQNFGGYPQDQEERYMSAGFIRTYAKANGYGLIDINRRFRLARDGIDVVNQHMLQTATNLANQTLPYTFSRTTQGDFDVTATFVNQATTLWSNLTNIIMQVGNRGDNIIVLSKDSSTGNLTVALYEGTSYPIYGFVSSVAASPASGDITFRITVKRGRVTLLYNNIQVADSTIPVFGGPFTPVIRATGSNVSAAIATVTANVGVAANYMPSLTDAGIYQSNSTLGGNVINHVNSRGIASIVVPVISNTKFSVNEAYNSINPLNTSGVTVDYQLPNLGTTAGNQSVLGGFTVNTGNVERVRWLANRSANGANYFSGELVQQSSVDATNMAAMVYNPSSFAQGWSVRTGGIDRLAVDTNGNVKTGGSNLTTATGGFTLVSTANGAPTGIPSATYGLVPLVYDTVNNKLWSYNGGWKSVQFN